MRNKKQKENRKKEGPLLDVYEVETSWFPRYFILLFYISSDRSRNLVHCTLSVCNEKEMFRGVIKGKKCNFDKV